jgi:hypothetical protein
MLAARFREPDSFFGELYKVLDGIASWHRLWCPAKANAPRQSLRVSANRSGAHRAIAFSRQE